MTDIEALFKDRKMKVELLIAFGFSENESAYTYSTDLIDGQFEMIVTVTKDGKVSAKVIDSVFKDAYVLHRLPNTSGEFVGRVRQEYENLLVRIADDCFEPDVFKSEDARQVIQYVRDKYRDELQFLWKFPGSAVFRRQDNAKWYAVLLIVSRKKLGLDEEGMVDIIDLRGKPEDIDALVDGKNYFPGYHMNKRHWLTICLDGSVPVEEIFCRIDESYTLAAKR
ncbi:MAG: MmcQ/YjbR family DNA-binding protein [Betaproteobacteria bacterium]|nr:MmcQ/YjbR family DNA-binding protein [Betaproteobacteria bacterium]